MCCPAGGEGKGTSNPEIDLEIGLEEYRSACEARRYLTMAGAEGRLSRAGRRCDRVKARGTLALIALMAVACVGDDGRTGTDSSGADATPTYALVDSGAPKLRPRDEASESFRAFRARALGAFARRDTAFLHAMLAPEIRVSFGPDQGIDEFKRMWKTDAANSDVWTALMRVLTMGGEQPSDSQFVAPYVYAFWPDSMDAFELVAVIGDSVRVVEAPTADSRVLGAALHSILKLIEWKGLPESGVAADTTWAQVRLPNGVPGWIRGASVYSPVSWRAMFVRRGERWQMVFFVAGD